MIKKTALLWILLFGFWISSIGMAMAGWQDLHFKPLHLVWGVVNNAPDGTDANGRTVQIYRGNDQVIGEVSDNRYYLNAFRLPGDTWAPNQSFNAAVVPQGGYDAGPVGLIAPPSSGVGIERMVDMTLGPVTQDLEGTQIVLTCFLEGYYDPLFGEPGHTVEQQTATVIVEARETPDGMPVATAQIELGDRGTGQNGFGVDLEGNYYLVIRHTNHLAVRTVNPLLLRPGLDEMTRNPNPPTVVNTETDELYQEAGYDTTLTSSGPRMVLRGGDFDGNGRVNAQDLVIWQNSNGSSPGMASWDERADGTGDTRVNAQDLILWQINNGLISYVVYH